MKRQFSAMLAGFICLSAALADGGSEVQVELQNASDAGQQKAFQIFKRIVKQRTGLDAIRVEHAPLLFGYRSDIGTEGFSIEEGPNGQVQVSGNELVGLMAGVGKFLRTARLETDIFEPGNWRGVSVPKSSIRGVYFASHFFNWYHMAPIEDVKDYLEELSLWGCNTICVWFDLHRYTGMDDPKAQEMIQRLRDILLTVQDVGLNPALTSISNEAFSTSPKELRAEWTPQNGYVQKLSHYHVEVCPNKPGGMEYLMKTRRAVLEAFKGVNLKFLSIGSYDQGGCTCDQCAPWGANGLLTVAPRTSALAREIFPGIKILLSTWYFDRYLESPIEWPAFDAAMGEQAPDWVDYLRVGDVGTRFPEYPVIHGAPGNLPMINFSEISMLNNKPWGGYGANPAPARMDSMWKQSKGLLSGGWPYSEGIYEDINKCIALQLYWSGQDPLETVREYMAYEFSPDAAEVLTGVAAEMEKSLNHRCKLPKSSTPLSEVLFPANPEQAPIIYHTPNLRDAEARLQRTLLAGEKLDPKAKQSWRWRVFYLRAEIDAELERSGGRPNEILDGHFEELKEIYYADQAIDLLRPPSRASLMALFGGRDRTAVPDNATFEPIEDEKIKVSSCTDPLKHGPDRLMDGIAAPANRQNFWGGYALPGKSPAWVVVDLGEVKPVKNIELQYRDVKGNFIFVPSWVSIEVSLDGVQFAGDENRHPVPEENTTYTPEFWNYPVNAPARFVRINLGTSQYRGVSRYRGIVELTEIKVNAGDQ